MGKSIHAGNLLTSQLSLIAGKMSGEEIHMADRSYNDGAAPHQQEGKEKHLQPAGLPAVYLHPPSEDRQHDDNASGHVQLLAGKMSGEEIHMADRSYNDGAAPRQQEGKEKHLQPASLPAPDQQDGEEQYLQPVGLQAVYLHPPSEDRQQDNNVSGRVQLPTQTRNPSICCTLERKIIIGLSMFVVLLLLGGVGMGVFAFYDRVNTAYGWSNWGSWEQLHGP